MKKRLLAILICVFMVTGLLPGIAFAADSTSVTVGGVELDGTAGKTYWKNGDTTSATGTETDYNAYFNSSTATLTLKNAAISGAASDASNMNSNYGIYADGDLTITLEGTNTVTADAATDFGVSSAIYVASNLTINGSGSLVATGGMAPGYSSCGICGGTVTIQDSATVTATGGLGAQLSEGLNGVMDINISGSATVTATGGKSTGGSSYGVLSNYGDITVSSSAIVTATGGSGDSSYGMCTDFSGVSIEGGNVTATGGTAAGTYGVSYGVRSNDSIIYTDGLLVVNGGTGAMNKAAQNTLLVTVDPLTGSYDGNFAVYGATDTYYVIQGLDNLDYTGVEKPTNVEDHITWTEAQGLEPATLTLNNVILNTAATEAIMLPSGAKLVIQGMNIAYNNYDGDNSKCIYGYDSLEISGTGSLIAIDGGTSSGVNYSHGVFVFNDLTVSGSVTLTAISGTATNNSYGFYSGTATFSGGTITAIGGTSTTNSSYGVYTSSGTQISESVKLTAIGGAAGYGSAGISSSNTTTISGGFITAIGGAAAYGSTGISSVDTTTISGGFITAIGGADDNGSSGISSGSTTTISGGVITAIGSAAPSSHSIYAGGGGIILTDVSIIAPAGAGISDNNRFIATTIGGEIPVSFVYIAADDTEDTCIVPNCTTTVDEGGFTEFTEIGGEKYYHISTAEQLAHINEHLDLKYIQTADIDLSEYNGGLWMPIGTETDPFSGSFDGGNYTIEGLTVDQDTNYAGLFGIISEEAVLEDINLSDVAVEGAWYVGGLVGSCEGSVTNCFCEGSVTGTGRYVGGLVGHNTGIVSGGSFEGAVSGSDYKVGGLVGRNQGVIQDVTIDNIQVTGTDYVGGLTGRNLPYYTEESGYDYDTGIIINCHVGSNAIITGNTTIGGFAGDNTTGMIEHCSSLATISGTYRVGGMIGSNSGTVTECFSGGSVTGNEDLNGDTGGLTGNNWGTVENCYSFASATGPKNVGGLIGRNGGTVTNCYSEGIVTGTGIASNIGGLIGNQQGGTVSNCYWDYQTSTISASGAGVACTTADMKVQATFVDWDFADIWTISAEENDGYPALAWQGFNSASSDATLSALSASGITLTPVFEGETTNYTANTSNSIRSTTISATASDGTAAISINGTTGTSKQVALDVGSNVITIEVTAEDGITTKTYTITIARAASTGGGGGGSSTPTGQQITVSTPDGETIVTGTLTESGNTEQITISGTQFKKLADANQGAVIPAPSATVTFDAKAMDAINGALSTGDVILKIKKLDLSTLTPEQQKRVGNRPVYDFTLTKGGQQISSFDGGHAKISIPYTLQTGENPHQVVIYYLTSTGTLKPVRGHYDAESECVVFETTHFSTYAVGYNPVSFNDVTTGAWYKDAIDFIAAREITSGTGVGTFSPETTLTRGQFIVLLMNAYGINPDAAVEGTTNFIDAGSTYYTNYLLAAKSLEIVNGVGNNMFAPEQAITRQEMFVMLYNALEVIEELPQASGGKKLSDFGDANQVDSWAREAMSALIEGGVISGSNGMLNPTASTTRAEMAQMLYNLLSK